MRTLIASIALIAVAITAPAAAQGSCEFTDASYDADGFVPQIAPEEGAGGRADLTSLALAKEGDDLVARMAVRDLDAPRHELTNAVGYALFLSFPTEQGGSDFMEIDATEVDGSWTFGPAPLPVSAADLDPTGTIHEGDTLQVTGEVDRARGVITLRVADLLRDNPSTFGASAGTYAGYAVSPSVGFPPWRGVDSVPDDGPPADASVDLTSCE